MSGISGQKRFLKAVLVASTALIPLGQVVGAHAQSTTQASTVAFNIPAQSLTSALTAFARQTGVKIAYPASLTAGKSAPALRGSYTNEQALIQLLAGTGLAHRFTSASAVTIVDPSAAVGNGTVAADSSLVLDTINVEGRISGAFGEENRFVAEDATAATKLDTPILETPASVNVVTRDQIETRGAQTMADTLKYAPGVTSDQGNIDRRFDLTKYSIRGYNPAILFDGTRLTPNSGWYAGTPSLDPYLLERVEVLGGPASTLYGQASPGGAVSFLSKRPTATPLREVFVGTGNYGRIQGGFDLGGPIDADGIFLYRLTGLGLNTGTQVDYTKDQRLAIAPAITWQPTDQTKLTILASYQYDPAKPGFATIPWVGSYLQGSLGKKIPRDFFWGEPDYNEFKRKQASLGAEFEHQFNDVFTFRQNAKFLYVDGVYRDIYPAGGLQADGRTLNRRFFGEDRTNQSIHSDTQIEARFDLLDAEHTTLFGFDYYRISSHNTAYIWQNTTPIDIIDPIYGNFTPPPDGDADWTNGLTQKGLYAQDFISWGNWRFLAGIRQDWADNWTKTTGEHEKSDAFTWRLGGSYVFDNGFAPYVNYATSFEPQAGTSAPERGNEPFKPTTGQQFEVGIKYQPLGLESFFTLAAFDIRQQNVLTADPIWPNASIQKGEVRSRGVTASATLSLSDNIDFLASYTYLNLDTTKATVTETSNIIGKVPWYAPEHVANVWMNYTFDSGALEGLMVGGGLRYVSSGYIDSSETLKLPERLLVDAAISYDFGAKNPALKGLEAQANVSNLFDEEYLATCLFVGGGCRYGDGRTITAQLKYRW